MSFATELLIGGGRVVGDGAALQVENPFSERTIATLAGASGEQVSAAVTAAAEAGRGWASTPALERGEMLHEAANRLRARSDELAHTMTLEGGKPLVENSDEIGWTAAAFDYYARSRQRRAPDTADRVDTAGDGDEGADGRGRLHRALELPAAAARLEARAGPRGRQRHRFQAVRADAAGDARRA